MRPVEGKATHNHISASRSDVVGVFDLKTIQVQYDDAEIGAQICFSVDEENRIDSFSAHDILPFQVGNISDLQVVDVKEVNV